MQKRLYVEKYGSFIGIKSNRLVVYDDKKICKEISLNRLKTLCISGKGVSLSTDLLVNLSSRGIRVFVTDFRDQYVTMVSGMHQHATTMVRQKQFDTARSDNRIEITREFITGKVKNQLSVINYFGKYMSNNNELIRERIVEIRNTFSSIIKNIRRLNANYKEPQQILLGYEGTASRNYWQFLRSIQLLNDDFKKREKRGTDNITNSCLNYGYAILTTPIWNSIENAGLEPYCGLMHTKRPGKPALVLDLMEEYRPWVVDRNIIKLRSLIAKKQRFDNELKKRIITEINNTLDNKYLYKKKRLKLENIIQRQIYRLAGCFCTDKKYRPYIFRW